MMMRANDMVRECTPRRGLPRLKLNVRFGSDAVVRPLPQTRRFADSQEPDGGDKFALD